MKKKRLIIILLVLIMLFGVVAAMLKSDVDEQQYFESRPTYSSEEIDNTRVIMMRDALVDIPQEEKWWEEASNEEVIDTLYNSLVFENEITHEKFRGVDNLEFAYNDEKNGYGGLKLIENPYDLSLTFYFQGTPKHTININEFSAVWTCPDGLCQFNLPSFKVDIPEEVESHEDVLNKLGLKEVFGETNYGKMVIGYEEVQ